MLRIDEQLSKLQGSECFCEVDFTQCYWEPPLHSKDKCNRLRSGPTFEIDIPGTPNAYPVLGRWRVASWQIVLRTIQGYAHDVFDVCSTKTQARTFNIHSLYRIDRNENSRPKLNNFIFSKVKHHDETVVESVFDRLPSTWNLHFSDRNSTVDTKHWNLFHS